MAEVNGVSYDDVTVIIAGMRLGGIDAVNYTFSEEDPEPVYDQGSRKIVGIGLGSEQLVDITIEMQHRAYVEFAAPAKAVGKSVLSYWPFTITVAYANKVQAGLFIVSVLNVLNIDTLDSCKVTGVDHTNRRGDKKKTVTLTLKGTQVV
jgi:hypothetical protein